MDYGLGMCLHVSGPLVDDRVIAGSAVLSLCQSSWRLRMRKQLNWGRIQYSTAILVSIPRADRIGSDCVAAACTQLAGLDVRG